MYSGHNMIDEKDQVSERQRLDSWGGLKFESRRRTKWVVVALVIWVLVGVAASLFIV